MGIFSLDIPGIVRGPTNWSRTGVASDAEIGLIEKWKKFGNVWVYSVGLSNGRHTRKTKRQRQVRASNALIESLRTGAVFMRCLIPVEVEIELAGFRRG